MPAANVVEDFFYYQLEHCHLDDNHNLDDEADFDFLAFSQPLRQDLLQAYPLESGGFEYELDPVATALQAYVLVLGSTGDAHIRGCDMLHTSLVEVVLSSEHCAPKLDPSQLWFSCLSSIPVKPRQRLSRRPSSSHDADDPADPPAGHGGEDALLPISPFQV